jgi:hypothetical protein
VTSPHTSFRDYFVLAFLSLVAAGLIALACLRPNPPREPVVREHPISWWLKNSMFFDGISLGADDCREAGPDAIRFLIYTLDHGNVGRDGPKPWLVRQWERFDYGIRLRFNFPIDLTRDAKDALEARRVLSSLHEDAAPAIPTCVRIIEKTPNRDLARDARAEAAARVLASIGSKALPEYLRLIRARPPETRGILIMHLTRDLETEPLSEAGRTQVLDVLLSACRDPNDEVRYAVFKSIANFRQHHGFRPEMRPAIASAVDLLSKDEITSTHEYYWIIGYYEQEASAAIPRLEQLLGNSNPNVAMEAATALALIDPTDRRVIPLLHSVLTSCPDTNMRHVARKTLRKFGEPLE